MVLVMRHGFLTVSAVVPPIGLLVPPPTAGHSGTLTTYTGNARLGTAGVTIQNQRITNGLIAAANNITIRNCWITGGGDWGVDCETDQIQNLTVDHCTIDGGTNAGNSAVLSGEHFTITNNNMTGRDNGISLSGGIGLIEGNYIHAMHPGSVGEAHVDGIQCSGGTTDVVIRGNWIESWDTSDIIMKSDFGPTMSGIVIEGNTLIADPAKSPPSSPIYIYRTTFPVSGIIVRNNRIQQGFGGGYVAYQNATSTWTNNIDYFTGLPAAG